MDKEHIDYGTIITLYCSILSSYDGSYTSADIYFKWNNMEFTRQNNPDMVKVIDAERASLTINVTRGGHCACCLPDKDVRNRMCSAVSLTVISMFLFRHFSQDHYTMYTARGIQITQKRLNIHAMHIMRNNK